VNHILDGSTDPLMGRGNFEGERCPIVKHRDTLRSTVPKKAQPIEVPFGMWAWIGPRNRELDSRPDPHEKGQFWGKGRSL